MPDASSDDAPIDGPFDDRSDYHLPRALAKFIESARQFADIRGLSAEAARSITFRKKWLVYAAIDQVIAEVEKLGKEPP